jgi:uncharacterized protein
VAAGGDSGSGAVVLRERVAQYLKAHHTMTVATVGTVPRDGRGTGAVALAGEADASASGGPVETGAPLSVPHAASVFYAVDDRLRLVFFSKTSSLHGEHIGGKGPVAVTVTENYDDWEKIRGVQMWGEARLLTGAAKAGALALYVSRFPFVRDIIKRPSMAQLMRGIGVYRVEPTRVAFTDNLTGVFGREVLDLRSAAGTGSPRRVHTEPAAKAAPKEGAAGSG